MKESHSYRSSSLSRFAIKTVFAALVFGSVLAALIWFNLQLPGQQQLFQHANLIVRMDEATKKLGFFTGEASLIRDCYFITGIKSVRQCSLSGESLGLNFPRPLFLLADERKDKFFKVGLKKELA